jgi:hypothetical protein
VVFLLYKINLLNPRDTNLLPERLQEIELREDTPLTRGRTDIAPGRSRIQKVMIKLLVNYLKN